MNDEGNRWEGDRLTGIWVNLNKDDCATRAEGCTVAGLVVDDAAKDWLDSTLSFKDEVGVAWGDVVVVEFHRDTWVDHCYSYECFLVVFDQGLDRVWDFVDPYVSTIIV